MKALTLHQPWATLIVLGLKSCETRSWACAEGNWGQLIAIHAGRAENQDMRWNDPEVMKELGLTPTPKMAVVAIARLKDCVPTSGLHVSRLERRLGDFTPGRFAWRLTQVQPLSEPVPCRGFQKLWTLPEEVEQEAMRRLLPPLPAKSYGE